MLYYPSFARGNSLGFGVVFRRRRPQVWTLSLYFFCCIIYTFFETYQMRQEAEGREACQGLGTSPAPWLLRAGKSEERELTLRRTWRPPSAATPGTAPSVACRPRPPRRRLLQRRRPCGSTWGPAPRPRTRTPCDPRGTSRLQTPAGGPGGRTGGSRGRQSRVPAWAWRPRPEPQPCPVSGRGWAGRASEPAVDAACHPPSLWPPTSHSLPARVNRGAVSLVARRGE